MPVVPQPPACFALLGCLSFLARNLTSVIGWLHAGGASAGAVTMQDTQPASAVFKGSLTDSGGPSAPVTSNAQSTNGNARSSQTNTRMHTHMELVQHLSENYAYRATRVLVKTINKSSFLLSASFWLCLKPQVNIGKFNALLQSPTARSKPLSWQHLQVLMCPPLPSLCLPLACSGIAARAESCAQQPTVATNLCDLCLTATNFTRTLHMLYSCFSTTLISARAACLLCASWLYHQKPGASYLLAAPPVVPLPVVPLCKERASAAFTGSLTTSGWASTPVKSNTKIACSNLACISCLDIGDIAEANISRIVYVKHLACRVFLLSASF